MKKNKLVATLLLVLVLALSFVSGVQDLKAQKNKTTNSSVKAKFGFCASLSTAEEIAACETNNRVRQDNNNYYVDGLEGVTAYFNVSGTKDLIINLANSTQRSVWFDFREKSFASNPHPSWWTSAPQQNVRPHFNVLEAHKAKELCNNARPCEGNFQTRMNAGSWKAAGDNTSYTLQWNPSSSQPYINTPERTSAVNVKYTVDSAGNESFIITPLPNACLNSEDLCSARYIAGLQGTLNKTTSAGGQYVMPFTLEVRFK